MSSTTLKVRYVWWYRNGLLPIALFLFLIIAACLVTIKGLVKYDGHHTAKLTAQEAATTVKVSTYFFISLLILCTLLLCWVLLKWIRMLRYHLEIESNGISIDLGSIYQDSRYFLTVGRISSANYHRGVIGKMLDFGYIEFSTGIMDRSNGKLVASKMGPFSNVIGITNAINAIAGVKGIAQQVADAISKKENHQIGKADELAKLIELKNQGKISDEEYNELKSKLFG